MGLLVKISRVEPSDAYYIDTYWLLHDVYYNYR